MWLSTASRTCQPGSPRGSSWGPCRSERTRAMFSSSGTGNRSRSCPRVCASPPVVLRRQTQLRALRPDLTYVAIRGNLDTRLRKLDRGDCEALVLAAAGVHRLGLGERITAYFVLTRCAQRWARARWASKSVPTIRALAKPWRPSTTSPRIMRCGRSGRCCAASAAVARCLSPLTPGGKTHNCNCKGWSRTWRGRR